MMHDIIHYGLITILQVELTTDQMVILALTFSVISTVLSIIAMIVAIRRTGRGLEELLKKIVHMEFEKRIPEAVVEMTEARVPGARECPYCKSELPLEDIHVICPNCGRLLIPSE